MQRSRPLQASLVALGLFLPLLGGTEVQAQAKGVRTVLRPLPGIRAKIDPRDFFQDRLILKFREGFRVRLPEGKHAGLLRDLRSPDGLHLGSLKQVLGKLRIERYFTRSVQDLELERKAILARLPQGCDDPADLNNYYRLFTGNREATLAALKRLLQDPSIETAEPEFRLEAILPAQQGFQKTSPLPTLPPPRTKVLPLPVLKSPYKNAKGLRIPTPNFEALQYYFAPAPLGLGLKPSFGILGAQGNPGQTVFHLEAAWAYGHEDISMLTRANTIGKQDFGKLNIPAWRDHGNASVGILVADVDAKGIRGIIPESKLRVCSFINGYANMFSLALKAARPGDVFSSSAVFGLHVGNKAYMAPFDYPQVTYDAIRLVALRGIPLAIPAGNTGTNLEDPKIFGKRYLPSSTPSGAFLVGATYGPIQKRVGWSNYGYPVRVNSWGTLVTSTAYGKLWKNGPEQTYYIDTWGGTSAATPQVAGVLASILSARSQQGLPPLGPNELLNLLEKTGTPVSGKIGVRPNLQAALKAQGLAGELQALDEIYPGQDLPIQVDLPKGDIFLLFLGLPGRPVPVPGTKAWMLAPTLQILAFVGPTGPKTLVKIPVPAKPELNGLRGAAQALVLPHQGGFKLTNGAFLRIR
ncbi:MAG TPA: hypothetical protein ENK02_12735 [Planctomycetes bacterium]|nr:hypothetical protein [Planctomycetota bacterium]